MCAGRKWLHRALSDVSLQTEIYRNLAIPACLIIYVFQWIKKTSISHLFFHTSSILQFLKKIFT